MKRKNYPLSRKSNIVIQDLTDEVLIYDLDANKAFALNETATHVWRMCDGNRSTADISREIGRQLKSPISEDMVWLALKQFRDDSLLEESSEQFVTPFDGMSRREIIKRVGFASAVALPVISSLIAPNAIHAATGNCSQLPPTCATIVNATTPDNLPPGCFCLSNLNCTSGICPVNSMVCAGVGGPICSEIGNGVGASAPCCPCQSNLDCAQGICPVNTMICADIGT